MPALPAHFWSRFGLHAVRRIGEEEEKEENEQQESPFCVVFHTPDFSVPIYDDDNNREDEVKNKISKNIEEELED